MKWRYSRRMMAVRCILVETTVPVRIRPRMDTRPVKGHFLSGGENVSTSFVHRFDSISESRSFAEPYDSSHSVLFPPLGAPEALCSKSFHELLSLIETYQCSCPQWRSWGYGNPDQHPCTICVRPCPVGCSWPWSWCSGRCEAASGKRARTGRSTRSPWREKRQHFNARGARSVCAWTDILDDLLPGKNWACWVELARRRLRSRGMFCESRAVAAPKFACTFPP